MVPIRTDNRFEKPLLLVVCEWFVLRLPRDVVVRISEKDSSQKDMGRRQPDESDGPGALTYVGTRSQLWTRCAAT